MYAMTSLETFLETEHLTYLPIYYYIDDNSGKKTPFGEKNNKTVEEINLAKQKRKKYFGIITQTYLLLMINYLI